MDNKIKLENKEIVLIALCAEYSKAIPHFEHVRPATLGMSGYAFRWALMKLQTEELIDGVDISKGVAQWTSFWPTKKGVEEGQKLYDVLFYNDHEQYERFSLFEFEEPQEETKAPRCHQCPCFDVDKLVNELGNLLKSSSR